MSIFRLVVAASCCLLSAAASSAQWSADASVNTLVAGGGSDNTVVQAKPRLAARGDGTHYICWWQSENAPVYWSLRMNRLDRAGVKLWASDLVISDKAASSASGVQTVNSVDYDLKADRSGNALLTFTDFRLASNRNVFAYRIDPSGSMLWGPDGVTLTNDSNFKRDPRIVQTSGDGFAVVWFSQGNFTSANPPSLRMQILSPSGAARLADGGVAIAVAATTSRPPDRFELVPSDNGSVIAAWIREFASSGSASRWVIAQKFGPTADGQSIEPKWNSGSPVTVFNQSVPFAPTYPRVALQPTADGGCVVAWTDQRAGAGLNDVFVQRLGAGGATAWTDNGVAAAVGSTLRQDPALAHDPGSGTTWVAWREADTASGQFGVRVQRLNTVGARQFGDEGTQALPWGPTPAASVRIRTSGDGAIVAWFNDAGSPVGQTVSATRIGPSGVASWMPQVVHAASIPSIKNFAKHPLDTTPIASIAQDGLAMSASYPTGVVLAWQDARADADDVLAQQFSACGTLGRSSAADFDESGSASIDDIFIYLDAWFDLDPRCDVDLSPGLAIDDLFVYVNLWFAGC